ncbi:UDP-N-acetylmuramoyl-tripeptide--D-alanyl-D-alanine ligase [Denitromonas iodatirespirans]|uniref:UDP-N-acetylmuramoyl-tripeptide--D-alanyl-D-alanine ligase n=1 Tax=Denitromonas iodatirespirans TaxID=2795389 RepID=A0A944DCG0_DENI1|nr:UDP-N-acetylmuramoyl-tripeptide--D-alanyl-D-alanine ligase [Denitromonas iodatirespirans]MBT0962496.1 UDP-N-acetylmuramoyl-tripeptide--D-alanyl-D-alanine ligase [Denitromonas iodatirespirans]
MIDLQTIAQALGAHATGQASIDAVLSDSRTLVPGCLFVALRGERFDGHDYLDAARQAGAAAAMVDRAYADAHPDGGDLPWLVVNDTRQGLGALAAWWRRRFDIPVIGVTGSNGKTTVKEMCAAIAGAMVARKGLLPDASVLATAGNFNNDIGMPLTLLRLRPEHCVAIIEMGMNHPGEIGYLSSLAAPTVAVISNALRAHLAGLGDLDAVAREKGAIYGGLIDGGVAVINADDAFAPYWQGINRDRQRLSFGLGPTAEVRADCELHGLGVRMCLHHDGATTCFPLQVPGLHNARNACAAAAACLAAGMTLDDVAAGLSSYRGTRGRLTQRAGLNGATVLDDTYNANPDSARVAIDVLAATPGRKVMVLGDMGELGEASAQMHDEVGGYAKSQGIDHLLALGQASVVAARNFGAGGEHFERIEDLIETLKKLMDEDTVVLVKGSRFMRMERVANAVTADSNGSEDGHAA